MADHMTAEQLRAELIPLNDLLGVVSGYAKIDDERVRLARGRLTALGERLSGMAAVPATEGRIYVVNRDGMATLCKDADDAKSVAADSDAQWPHNGPHVVARLSPVPTWQPIETAPKRTRVVVGYRNSQGKWRTAMATYFTEDDIAGWENDCSPGWYERSYAHEAENEYVYALEAEPRCWQSLPPEPPNV